MNLDSVIFIDSLAKLDLHGLDSVTAEVLVNDFIKDNVKMKNEFINIVHGRGSGILRRKTHEILRLNKNVLEFKTYYNNDGCTVVKLKI